ncbi:unnamed protein product [Rhizoctonia solani]|uniref:DUF6533 domain-containing protein n=1 Tax=Rhizoctonia solani TaxID=456999 RepID=A0A8H3GHS3_9AGAM|nr:unnamed protein product [Rhizoctonia solani]
MPDPPEIAPEQLAELIADITSKYESLDVTKALGIAAATILLYDIVSTLDTEIKYVWRSNWTFARVAFHLNRLWIIVLMGIYIPTLFIYGLSETLLVVTVLFQERLIYIDGSHLDYLRQRPMVSGWNPSELFPNNGSDDDRACGFTYDESLDT